MKKVILIAVALIFSLQGAGRAATNSDNEEARTTIEQADKPPCASQPNDKAEVGQRGCCSWHGGACGCENGRVKCCDGTLSPSCGC